METREKILLYYTRNNIPAQEFAEAVGVSKQTLSKMITGKNRVTIDVLLGIRKVYRDIDMNALLDENESEFIVAESKAPYGNDNFKAKLSEDLKKVIKQLEKYTK